MKAVWLYRHKFMGRYRCVSLSGSSETCLSGELGEIWSNGSKGYKAFIIDPAGNEKIFSFEYKDLDRWVLKLKVPTDVLQQCYWANNPNERFYGER